LYTVIKSHCCPVVASEKAQQGLATSSAMDVDGTNIKEEEEEKGLTFDDTSEFIRAVGNNPIPGKRVKKEPVEGTVSAQPETPSRDVLMAPGDQAIDEVEAGEVIVKEEEEDDEMAMLDAIENALLAADAEAAGQSADAIGGTAAEQTFKGGMSATLNILRQQGILATPAADTLEREKVQKQRDVWLAEQRARVAQRDLERLNARGGAKDQATREYENRMREQREARENLEAFKNYKPDVNIVYYDEYGRSLTPKEAWKALSHKFHGKGSGKMKTEKRLKKIAEEKKQAAMISGDTPLSMNQAFQQRQLKTGQAHFVLSVGNRG
jgi:U4/U6.U5 tri-snRNP-associated protein 1